tara:strand:- start:9646 stop:12168 length:2523 start_codon:yes stop_codon:yes gene_type:complete
MASNVRFLDQVSVSAYGNTTAAGSGSPTGSFMITGSVNKNNLTFTKGDGTTFELLVNTGSLDSISSLTGSLLSTASIVENTITFTKGDGSQFNIIVATGSGGDGSTNGIFTQIGSTGIFSTTSSLQITGSTLQQSPYIITGANITASNAGTGGGVNKYAMSVSESIWHYNDNVGVPTSKAWKTDLNGSYFNNFDQNSDTSEIIRFMAGLLSSSAPDASPNTKVFNTIGETILNTTIGTAPAGRVPNNTTNSTVTYLTTQNFASVGQEIFNGISTIYTNPLYTISYLSVASGSTIVSSSNDIQLFSLGTIGLVFNVSGSTNFKFENNNNSVTTTNSSSHTILSKTGPGTTNGLTIGNISTNNSLIPAAFQDGKFANVFSSNLYNNSVDFTNTGSIGFYEISGSIRIQTGSGIYTPLKTQTERIFYAPISALNTNIPDNTISLVNPFSSSISATSRSLSGAPYLLTSNFKISSSLNGLFNPLYAASTIGSYSKSDNLVTISNPTFGAQSASLSGGTINIESTVFSSTGVLRNTNTIPQETDIVRLTGSLAFNAGTSLSTNIQASGLGTEDFSINTLSVNKNNTSAIQRSDTFKYFNGGTFSQPLDSGSMAYYGYAQGNDTSTLTGKTEGFKGENFRVKINDNLLTGKYATSTHFITSSYNVYNLAKYDLQVKPNYLIFPGGSNQYWLKNPDTSTDYKYYARTFQTEDSSTRTSLTLNVGQNLIGWGSTSDGIAIAIMFESAQVGTEIPASGGSTLPRPVLYDFASTTGAAPASNQANNDQLNPFSVNIDVGINFGGSISGTTYTMPLTDTLNMLLNSTYRNFTILIRYKGNVTPLQNITIGY